MERPSDDFYRCSNPHRLELALCCGLRHVWLSSKCRDTVDSMFLCLCLCWVSLWKDSRFFLLFHCFWSLCALNREQRWNKTLSLFMIGFLCQITPLLCQITHRSYLAEKGSYLAEKTDHKQRQSSVPPLLSVQKIGEASLPCSARFCAKHCFSTPRRACAARVTVSVLSLFMIGLLCQIISLLCQILCQMTVPLLLSLCVC